MGPGNQVLNTPTSPAYKNVNGPGVVNSPPNGQMSNSASLMPRNNANPAMQGVQLPQMPPLPNHLTNPGQPNAPMVTPTQFGQQGTGANFQQGQPNQLPPLPNFQQQGQPNYQQPPLMNVEQGPALPMNNQSMQDLRIPELSGNARDIANTNGPSLLPASHNVATPTLDPAPTTLREPTARVLAEYTPSSKSGEAARVVTTPVEYQPAPEAPIVVPTTVISPR